MKRADTRKNESYLPKEKKPSREGERSVEKSKQNPRVLGLGGRNSRARRIGYTQLYSSIPFFQQNLNKKGGVKVENLKEYIINEKTILLKGEYDPFGNLCTRVFEGDRTFLVDMAPVALINHTLLHQGGDFRGALESSRFLLGPIKMYPIKINAVLDIWLFPTKAYKKDSCAWFALTHIRKTKAIGVRKTEVSLSYGHTFTVEMKQSSFNDKRQKADDLREMMTKNIKNPLSFYVKPKQGFYIFEDSYRLKGKNPRDSHRG
ncbi:competence protein ComK [Bacillota bacterium Lsc_1132]